MSRPLVISLIVFSCAFAASAQTTDPSKLEELAEQQKQAETQAGELSEQQEKLKTEIGVLQGDLVKETSKSRGFERAEKQARERLETLTVQEDQLNSAILNNRDRLADLLASLQRIEKTPPPALLISAQNATDTARAAGLIEFLTESLTVKADALKAELLALDIVRQDIAESRKQVAENAAEVETRLVSIKSGISKKSNLNSQLDQDRKRKIDEAEELAAEAQNLRDLIRSFEERADDIAPRIKPPRSTGPSPQVKPPRGQPAPVYVPSGGQRFADARGSLPLPVLGTLSRAFGAKITGGGRSKGVSLKTAKNAQVVAPFDGRVEFSGPFDDEHVVILNVGSGYFIVMTGMGETFTSAGDSVVSGEPLGIMPKRAARAPELFMEFRKDRSSIDPAPWIGTALAKTG